MVKVIKISEIHYIIVDDSEIKEGDWFYNEPTNYVGQALRKEGKFWVCNNIEGFHLLSAAKKITHSTQPLEGKLISLGYCDTVEKVKTQIKKDLIIYKS